MSQPQKLLTRTALGAASRVQGPASAATQVHRAREPISNQRGAAQNRQCQYRVEDGLSQAAFL